jgi:hypothetical protein
MFLSNNIRWWTNKRTNEREHKILKKEYVSYIGSVDNFKKYVYSCALKNNNSSFKNLVLLSDGATWIRNLKEELFPEAQQILNFFYLCKYLFSFAKFYFNNKESEYIPWIEKYKIMLKNGNHLKVIDEFSKIKSTISKKAPMNIYKYLLNNINNIDYNTCKDNNFFIGSGAVESGNKTVLQQRLKGPGMRWNVESAQRLLTLKAKNESNNWFEDVVIPVYRHYQIPLQ